MITRESLAPFESLGVVAAAKALHVSTRTINQLADKLGVEFKTQTPGEMDRRKREREDLVPAIRWMADEGVSQRGICEALGITRAILRRIAEENWIDIDNRRVCRHVGAPAPI